MRASLIVLLFLCTLIPAIAQEDDGFSAFLTEFKTAVKQKDKNKVAELTFFPLIGFDFAYDAGLPSGSSEIDKETFLKAYSKLFTSKRVKKLLMQDPVKTSLYSEDEEEAYYTLIYASDETFSCWLVFGKIESGEWKLIFTDNISYE